MQVKGEAPTRLLKINATPCSATTNSVGANWNRAGEDSSSSSAFFFSDIIM